MSRTVWPPGRHTSDQGFNYFKVLQKTINLEPQQNRPEPLPCTFNWKLGNFRLLNLTKLLSDFLHLSSYDARSNDIRPSHRSAGLSLVSTFDLLIETNLNSIWTKASSLLSKLDSELFLVTNSNSSNSINSSSSVTLSVWQ